MRNEVNIEGQDQALSQPATYLLLTDPSAQKGKGAKNRKKVREKNLQTLRYRFFPLNFSYPHPILFGANRPPLLRNIVLWRNLDKCSGLPWLYFTLGYMS